MKGRLKNSAEGCFRRPLALEYRLQLALQLIDINTTCCWKIFRQPLSGVSTDVDKHDRVSKSRKQTQQPEETRFAGRFKRFMRMITPLGG